MSRRVTVLSYVLVIIAGGIISLAPAPWRTSGLVFLLIAFGLPLLAGFTSRQRDDPRPAGRIAASTLSLLENLLKSALARSAHVMTGGTMSDYYIDIDLLQTDHEQIDSLVLLLAAQIREAAQRLGGAERLVFIERDAGPIGAVGLVASLTRETGIDAVILRPRRLVHRGEVKPPGVLRSGMRVVLVTDVATGGGHIRSAVETLRRHGIDQGVFPVVLFACREEKTAEQLSQQGVELYPLYQPETLAQMLEALWDFA